MQRRERRRRHRWRRRTLYTLAVVVLVVSAGAGGVYLYATYRFDQIKKIHSKHLVATASIDQKPFNLLLVGSDSRAFVSNATQANAFGTESNAGGQRSDVTIVARFDPAAKTVTVLSIPRDLWVHIPGDVSGISGMNRINAAFDSGPDLLVQTIEDDLGIPINHYMAVDFPGFSGMVDALGGITMDFPTEVRDQYTGLHVTTTGCQVVNGTTALELVRSRHLSYVDTDGYWEGDGLSDFSRIQRQDAFFHAVLQKLNQTSLNPFTINAFIGAAVTNLTIDDTLSRSDLLHIAEVFRGLPSSHLVTETLPTVSYTSAGGAAALKMAQPYAAGDGRRVRKDRHHPGGPSRHPPAGEPSHHHDHRSRHEHDDGAAPGGLGGRVQRVGGERQGHLHRGGVEHPGFHGERDRRRHDAPDPRQPLADPLRTARRHRGDDPGHGPRGTGHPDRRSGDQRRNRVAVDRRLGPQRQRSGIRDSPLGAGDHAGRTGPHHDDDRSRRRLREHPARALESHALLARAVHPGVAHRWLDQGIGRHRQPVVAGTPTGVQADLRRCRTIRRRSRSVVPPQIPSRLAVEQRVLQACLPDRADGTDRLGLGRVGLVLGGGVERLDVQPPTGGLLAPRGGDHGKHFLITGSGGYFALALIGGPYGTSSGWERPRISANKEYVVPLERL